MAVSPLWLGKPVPFFGFRYLKICPFQPYTKLYTLSLTDFEKNALQIRHFQENWEITSTCSKMAIFIPTSMKLGRHMYPYTWQLSAKFGKIQICQRKVIAKNDEFTMHYVIARLMRAVHCADDNGVKLTAMKCPFEWYQVWYMFTQKIVSKSHLNKGHYTNSAEFPPYYNTYRPWRHFLRLLFGCVSMGGRSCQSTRRNMFIMHQVLLVLHAVLASPF